MIKIKKKEDNTTPVGDLAMGSTFIYKNEYFITTNIFKNSFIECVNLKSGEVVSFSFSTVVEKIDFKLTIERK